MSVHSTEGRHALCAAAVLCSLGETAAAHRGFDWAIFASRGLPKIFNDIFGWGPFSQSRQKQSCSRLPSQDSARGEIRGLCWADFDGKELSVRRSVWNSTVNEPKTNRSKAPIPVVKQLADALDAHRLRIGVLAQPNLPIFQAGNGKPLNHRIVEILLANGVETFESCEGGSGHAFHEPTVRFHGSHAEGFRALSVALQHGLRVCELRRYYSIEDGEPVGPRWEMTFLAGTTSPRGSAGRSPCSAVSRQSR